MNDLGKLNYESYCKARQTNFPAAGLTSPTWEEIGESLQASWTKAAEEVSKAAIKDLEESIDPIED